MIGEEGKNCYFKNYMKYISINSVSYVDRFSYKWHAVLDYFLGREDSVNTSWKPAYIFNPVMFKAAL